MTLPNENEEPFFDCMATSWEIWDLLVTEGGLDIKKYDSYIVKKLRELLNIPSPCKDIKVELKKRNISPEHFIGAFFRAIQPYAQMMSDLCVFFYMHGVKETNRAMKILFNFGKGPEDLGFDIKHFRETILKYRAIYRCITIYGWTVNSLWNLAEIFREFWHHTPQHAEAKNWLSLYTEKGEFNHPLPIFPITGINEIDFWIQRVWRVWATIVFECRRYGSNRADLIKQYQLISQNSLKRKQNSDMSERDTNSYESLRLSKELPGFEDWTVETLFLLDNDKWPEAMLSGLIGFMEKLKPSNEKMERIQSTIAKVRNLFSTLPCGEVKRKDLLKELNEILKLPIWNKRHELYQTWVLTQIDQAMENYDRTIHHVDGELVLKFSGTHVGTIETEKGRIHIWSELRSPLANPIGKGRKRNIQPDYSLTFEPVTSPSQTVTAIECKQYLKAKPKSFADALTDYAKGKPNAKILLVNYGETPDEVLSLVEKKVRGRTFSIGNFMPSKVEEIQNFRLMLFQSLPKPIAKGKTTKHAAAMPFDLIGVDISASMEKLLTEKGVLKLLQMVIDFSPHARLLATDTAVRREWAKAESSLQELLDLPRNGGTDLPKALFNYDLGTAAVLTDNDGFNQLSRIQSPPHLLIEVKTAKTIYFHYSD
ncbi:MAG: hypothetical protein OEW62_00945 [Candidatus Bathyarchaeota archaeon]|nr:hypothetical protein [Candidatus Bathyarchaeota archaeon]